MKGLKRFGTYLVFIAAGFIIVAAFAGQTAAPGNVSHFILEDIIESICCFIPALLLGGLTISLPKISKKRTPRNESFGVAGQGESA